MRQSASALIDLFYPPHCVNCGFRQPQDVWLCGSCAGDLPRIKGPRCKVCSKPFDGMLDAFVCPGCHGQKLHLDCTVSVMHSKGVVRDLIHRFKYGREFHVRRVLGEWLCEAFEDTRISGMTDARLVGVPLHPARRRDRQFNQAQALAEWVGKRRKLPLANPLVRRKYTQTQTQFDRKQRMRNLRGAFSLRQNARVMDESFLLVDDVLTTGATLDECTRILLEGGARCVRAITVARG